MIALCLYKCLRATCGLPWLTIIPDSFCVFCGARGVLIRDDA